MKSLISLLTLIFACNTFALTTGTPAPDFTLQNYKLSELKGKIIVLEWLNHGCPFVRKHYDSGNMQALQKKYTAKDVVWLSIISSAPGKQGYVDSKGALKDQKNNNSKASAILLDPTGKVGMLYGAKTTPHMYVINKKGLVVYQGAIDDQPDTNPDSIKTAKNYLSQALNELMSGKEITAHTTKAYGCSIKYP